MTRSPSRGRRRARSTPARPLVAAVALPFVLVGILASKVLGASSRRRHRNRAEAIDAADEPSYRVELGDTVSEIAIRHGLPTAHVLAQNGLSWKTPIFLGQVIRLEPIPDDLEWPTAETIDEGGGQSN